MVSNRLLLYSVKKNNFMLRSWKGRDVIESDTLSKLSEMDKELQPFFTTAELDFDSSLKEERVNNIKVKRTVVYSLWKL